MQAHIVEDGVVVDTIMVVDLDHPVAEGRLLIDGSEGGIGWSYVDGQLVAPLVLHSLEELLNEIDTEADIARHAVAGDPLRAEEYKLAQAEALEFKAAGYPEGIVPRSVAAWAIDGLSPQQAADDILLQAAQYNEALYQLRETRLAAKGQVRAAMQQNNPALAQAITAQTVAGIRAAVSGIGNNTGGAPA